ncbi:carboxypeptidase-like regulatory domain-containing protein [Halomarina oriensis]|uniref:Uncharacterized protein n=1 Tax=Halomarina oriensis TaxID=671145 RepID=A0A6B0GXA8_9EURY|nr:carboxypeptidase-like regulatory domain-containing protein [Halomarina oriensis]MWG36398.1 hypothetical protein [Halomarina oriensis]
MTGVSGCNASNTSGTTTTNGESTARSETTSEPDGASSRIDGQVFDLSNEAVPGATVEAIVPSTGVVDRTTADEADRFELATTDEAAEGGREYDHIRLGGPATVEFETNEASPDGVVWSRTGT